MTNPAIQSELQQDVCETLCELLRDGADIHRCLAARALGEIGDPRAVGPLVAALLDEDGDVRADAAAALARQPDPEAGAQLLQNLLGDPVREVKLHAIDALAALRHPDLGSWLCRIVRGRCDEISWSDPATEGGWDDWIDVRIKAVEGLAALGCRDAVPAIVDAIDDEFGPDLSEVGFAALARLGPLGLDALMRYGDHANIRWRRRAVAWLVAAIPDLGDDAVARALNDRETEVRLAAARALAKRDPSHSRLAALFLDASAEIRAEIARLCGRYHPGKLLRLLADADTDVRIAALEQIAAAPDRFGVRSAKRLRRMLRATQPAVAGRAAEALGAVDPDGCVGDLALLLATKERPVEARLGAVNGLARGDGPAAVAALSAVIVDPSRRIRLAALAALAGMSVRADWPNGAGDTLLAVLSGTGWSAEPVPTDEPQDAIAPADDDPAGAGYDGPAVRSGAFPTSTLDALSGEHRPPAPTVQDDEAIELTQRDLAYLCLTERTPRKRRVAVEPEIDPRIDARRCAARVLGGVAREDVARALAERLEDGDQEVRRAAAESLVALADRIGKLPDGVLARLAAGLTDDDDAVRALVVRAIGCAGAETLSDAICLTLDDPDSVVRAEGVRVLAKLAGPHEAIAPRLHDFDATVRLAAAEALSRAPAPGQDIAAMLVDFAFDNAGQGGHEATRLLRNVDPATVRDRLLNILHNQQRRREWSVAIEVLGDLEMESGDSISINFPK